MFSYFIVYVVTLTLIIIYIYIELTENKINSNDIICKNLYIDNNNKYHCIIPHFLSNEECDNIMNEGNKYATENEWTKNRHDNYPTTDNQITDSWNNYHLLETRIKHAVYPILSEMFSIQETDIGINEIFIAKYEPKYQNRLKPHEDGSEFSIIIALNDDYKGGGTYFTKLKKLIKLKKGECLIFSGQNRHCGKKVTHGKRFIITGFLHYKNECYCCYNNIDSIESYINNMLH